MKKRLLSGILALSGFLTPLKAQAHYSQTVPENENSNLSANVEKNSNDCVETVGINGMPFLIYTPSEIENKKIELGTYTNNLQKILKKNVTSTPPPQADLEELLNDIDNDSADVKIQQAGTPNLSPSDVIAPTISEDPQEVKASTPKTKKELDELLAITSDSKKAETDHIIVSEKESGTTNLLAASISPTPLKLDINKTKRDNEDSSGESTAVTPVQKQSDTTVSSGPKSSKIVAVDSKQELDDLLAATSSDFSKKISDSTAKVSHKEESEETIPPKKNDTDSLPNSDDSTSSKIAFGLWAALLGIAAIQGKKYLDNREKTEYWPEEGPFPWNELAEDLPNKRKPEEEISDKSEEILTTKDPLSPFSPIDLQNYLTETLSPSLIKSAIKKKQEGVKLLPYHPVELEILPAKDPLLENNREILAQRLLALKTIDEIQKERSILTKMIAKARYQKDEKAIATITARRKMLSEKIKKARLMVIGNQLDSIREQRRLLTKKITLARRKHDHWQIDSVQKQRVTLKTKEKTVKGFVRKFSYSDYRRQWHIQKKKALSRAA